MSDAADADLCRLADRLTVICGFAELLRDGSYGALSPDQQRVVDLLAKEAREAGVSFQQVLLRRSGTGGPPAD